MEVPVDTALIYLVDQIPTTIVILRVWTSKDPFYKYSMCWWQCRLSLRLHCLFQLLQQLSWRRICPNCQLVLKQIRSVHFEICQSSAQSTSWVNSISLPGNGVASSMAGEIRHRLGTTPQLADYELVAYPEKLLTKAVCAAAVHHTVVLVWVSRLGLNNGWIRQGISTCRGQVCRVQLE